MVLCCVFAVCRTSATGIPVFCSLRCVACWMYGLNALELRESGWSAQSRSQAMCDMSQYLGKLQLVACAVIGCFRIEPSLEANQLRSSNTKPLANRIGRGRPSAQSISRARQSQLRARM
ncbi:hypothetical protein BU23DRAFT_67450 [Bimuria novae-zelandiae CBS 107.79]|uniref:Secreted protein n=1 Tax=Bimuria novae-zelandiae CBS 107.79 TaxID=1447943 RepID=A0A6A5VFC7_9PLEO|nr:hypothetical protein BU23DRAFT_67450 [Bimuria novae-zelandiae CBS 107.79]